MNELSKGKFMTTKEVAIVLGVSERTVQRIAKKCFPNKRIEQGKSATFSNTEVTVMIDRIKHNNDNQHHITATAPVGLITTNLTPALMIKQAMELMQKGYELELQRIESEKQVITEERNNLQIELDSSKEWTTLQKYFDKKNWSADRKKLSIISKKLGELGYKRKKIFSVEYQNGLWSYRIEDLDNYFNEPEF